ncbi:MAG: polyprenyl synthetase family protein [Nanoarchaeota archaeon]
MIPFLTRKSDIDAYIDSYLREQCAHFNDVNEAIREACTRLIPYTLAGKSTRGCLLLFIHDALDGKDRDDAMKAAAAIELFHSGLLIHDDLIDDDDRRRGMKAMHIQCAEYIKDEKIGKDIALCIGNLACSLSFKLLSNQDPKMIRIFSDAFATVCIGQIHDILPDKPSTAEEWLALYRNKTARYSFSLPMAIGAMLAGRADLIVALQEWGDDLGIIYQLRDDELDDELPIELKGMKELILERTLSMAVSLPFSEETRQSLKLFVDFCATRER